MTRTLSHEQARAFYNRFGAKQDLQRFYESRAIELLEARSDFEHARAVVEFGCGTGSLAAELLSQRLPSGATYVGLDVSPVMLDLARSRLARWGDRARVLETDGSPAVPLPAGSCDRFLSTYVLDLLSLDDIRAVLREAARVLEPGGLLCLASLTSGQGVVSRAICRLWTRVHTLRPALVGGCRPLRLGAFLDGDWGLEDDEVVCAFGVCTEVMVARVERGPE